MTTARQNQDEERFSVKPDEQEAMTLLRDRLKLQIQSTPYDLQNLPFDPAVEAMKAAGAVESATKPSVATLPPRELKDSDPVLKP